MKPLVGWVTTQGTAYLTKEFVSDEAALKGWIEANNIRPIASCSNCHGRGYITTTNRKTKRTRKRRCGQCQRRPNP